jgi:biopolymer transport protein ExbD
MEAMDSLHKVGIENIGLITEKKREPGAAGGGQ